MWVIKVILIPITPCFKNCRSRSKTSCSGTGSPWKKSLKKKELILALEGFSRHLSASPVAPSTRELFRREESRETIMRTLLERLGLAHVFEASDEEIHYHFNLLQEFFARALDELSGRQLQVIKLAAIAGHSLTEIAREMNFTSLAAMRDFQRNAFRAVVTSLCMLLSLELDQPEIEARRKAVIAEWRELFAGKAAVCFK